MITINLKTELVLVLLVIGLKGIHAQTVNDVDGNTYNTITIGSQTWLKEDLKVSHFQNHDIINTTADTTFICYENNPEYQWAYDGKEAMVKDYGRLYTYKVVIDERKVCPAGWHVPTIQEWKVFKKNLGIDTISIMNKKGILDNMKLDYISGILNKQGFMLQSVETRQCNGKYIKTPFGGWWTMETGGERSAIIRFLPIALVNLKTITEDKRGLPIRCIKD
jgi:uncharacterized protein (TIGR02145 family)